MVLRPAHSPIRRIRLGPLAYTLTLFFPLGLVSDPQRSHDSATVSRFMPGKQRWHTVVAVGGRMREVVIPFDVDEALAHGLFIAPCFC